MDNAVRLDKFGVTDENGEIVVDRVAELKDFVNRGVYILKEIDTLKQDMKGLIDEADELGYDKAELKSLIKHAHKNSLTEEIEKLEAIQVKLDNLFGGEDD